MKKTYKNRGSYFYAMILCMTSTLLSTQNWNWDLINTNELHFPQNFLWGTSMLAYEVEGNAKNNTWLMHESYIKTDGTPFAQKPSGIAIDHWNRYKEDIQLMKKAGMTSLCFSVDWSKIEPQLGIFDEQALMHYADICDELNKNNIIPIVIFKDYRDPLWFIEQGGFEVESNNRFFIEYCLKVTQVLSQKVFHYVTFWAPESYAMLAYWNNSHPPFKHSMQLAAKVFKNQLEAHVLAYNAIKATHKDNRLKIGIIKHMAQLKPWYLWDTLACKLADLITDEPFYSFFTTGLFKVRMAVPGKLNAHVFHTNPKAPESIDFIGINYHSHSYMKNFRRVEQTKNKEIATDLPGFTLYAEGLYDAIKELSNRMAKKLNIPIYITQNGIATTNNSLRTLHAKRHLYSISQAINDGYNVLGYHYYSLFDCYTWGGYDKKFGLFSVDPISLKRTLKPGACYYLEIIKKFTGRL